MRSGRLDRKIEFPAPKQDARARILQIHSRKMNVHPDVNFEELARTTEDFNGAQLKVRISCFWIIFGINLEGVPSIHRFVSHFRLSICRPCVWRLACLLFAEMRLK
mmetsp:Transcript_4401/g.11420  ORF Transcript_4401/g.11420 Transcript_4401/m.11420 type:complete len:106 (-) Transcript_4401:292-609(-)